MLSMRKCLVFGRRSALLAGGDLGLRSPGDRRRRPAASEIKYIVNNTPITTYDIQKRAAFLKLQHKAGASPRWRPTRWSSRRCKSQELERRKVKHHRKPRSMRRSPSSPRSNKMSAQAARRRPRPGRRDRAAFQGIHPRPDGLEPGAVARAIRAEGGMSEQDAVQRMLQRRRQAERHRISAAAGDLRRAGERARLPRSASASARPRRCARASPAARRRASSPRA